MHKHTSWTLCIKSLIYLFTHTLMINSTIHKQFLINVLKCETKLERKIKHPYHNRKFWNILKSLIHSKKIEKICLMQKKTESKISNFSFPFRILYNITHIISFTWYFWEIMWKKLTNHNVYFSNTLSFQATVHLNKPIFSSIIQTLFSGNPGQKTAQIMFLIRKKWSSQIFNPSHQTKKIAQIILN